VNKQLGRPERDIADLISSNWHRGCSYLPRHGGESIHVSEELKKTSRIGLSKPESVNTVAQRG
jgi:hypothetical protein